MLVPMEIKICGVIIRNLILLSFFLNIREPRVINARTIPKRIIIPLLLMIFGMSRP